MTDIIRIVTLEEKPREIVEHELGGYTYFTIEPSHRVFTIREIEVADGEAALAKFGKEVAYP